MELTDIMALVKAGYTKEEIAQMEAPQPQEPTPVPTPAPAPEVVPAAPAVPTPTPVQQPTQTQPPEPSQPTMADIMQGIAKLTSAVQANAIAQSVIPQGLQNPPQPEDMLAEIIRPTFKPRGD